MAEILHRLGYIERGRASSRSRATTSSASTSATRRRRRRRCCSRAYGGVLFIDEAYYLYQPENERDYGEEAIEILLQVMEAERDKLVVIFAGYKDRMDDFFRSNPGMQLARRAPHRLPRLRRRRADARSRDLMLEQQNYVFGPEGAEGVPRVPRAAACGGRASRTAAASATRSTGRACGRRTGSSPTRDGARAGRADDDQRRRHPEEQRLRGDREPEDD